ncbi:MAG: hypothetical protein LAT68_00565 [Cyclobacteriaceae bacterium]|nr:Crp/Fnr family transcriptional regulator [Cyclobacteriaceae bacterium]MCH8514795.1 hypothetical protein [Cyclobacteriaceae bacterium]
MQLELAHIIKQFLADGEKKSIIPLNDSRSVENEGMIYINQGLAKIFAVDQKGDVVNTDLLLKGEIYQIKPTDYPCNDLFYVEPMKLSEILYLPKSGIPQVNNISDMLNLFLRERLNRIHRQKVRNYGLTLKERLLNFLYDFSLIYGKMVNNCIEFPNFFTHYDLSLILMSSRQSICKLLKQLNEEKGIIYTRYKIRIPNHIMTSLEPTSKAYSNYLKELSSFNSTPLITNEMDS